MRAKYSIFFMNNAVMLCLVYQPSLIKNFDLSSVFPVDPVTYNMINNFFFCWNLLLLPGMKPVTSSSPEIYLAIMWMSRLVLQRTSKSVMLGMPISCPACRPTCRACQTQMASRSACPACQTGWAKTGNESSARREIWDRSLARSVLGCEGTKPFFSCLWDVISKYQWSL